MVRVTSARPRPSKYVRVNVSKDSIYACAEEHDNSVATAEFEDRRSSSSIQVEYIIRAEGVRTRRKE